MRKYERVSYTMTQQTQHYTIVNFYLHKNINMLVVLGENAELCFIM